MRGEDDRNPEGNEGLVPDDQGPIDPTDPASLHGTRGGGIVRAVARLRLLMASAERRYTETQRLVTVLRQQLRRVPTRAVNGHLAIDAYLAVMAETRSRLARAEQDLQDLELLKRRVTQEIQALELMGHIQQTQQELAELREQARWDPREEVAEEIRRLETLAQQYTAEAARSITSGGGTPPTLEPPQGR